MLAPLSSVGARGARRGGEQQGPASPLTMATPCRAGGCLPNPGSCIQEHTQCTRPPPVPGAVALTLSSPSTFCHLVFVSLTRGLAPLHKWAEATLPVTAVGAQPCPWGGGTGPQGCRPHPRLSCCCLPRSPRHGLLKRSQGPQVTLAGSHSGLHEHVGLCPLARGGRLPAGVSPGPWVDASLPGWVSPLEGAPPVSRPPEAPEHASRSFSFPRAAQVQTGEAGAGGLAGAGLGSAALAAGSFAAPGPPLAGFCPAPPHRFLPLVSPPSRRPAEAQGKLRLKDQGWRHVSL